MIRVASLFLPNLAVERVRRDERLRAGRQPPGALPLDGGGLGGGGLVAKARAGSESTPPLPLPIEGRGFKSPPFAPLALAHRSGQRLVLAAVSPEAAALGLEPGMALARARALVPGLDVRDAEPEADSALLARLALFAARRWTPRAAVWGEDGVWLDLSGTAHLFGGEERMARHILAFCARAGFTARIAVAATPGAAHALARFGGKPLLLCPVGAEVEALAPLPIAALRAGEEALAAASRLGLETVGDLLALPRAPLSRRFGRGLVVRLDQALGRAAEPFEPIVPEEPPAAILRFLEPIATPEAIGEAAGEAVRRLVRRLEQAGLGARRLALICTRVDNIKQTQRVGFVRATRDEAHLRRLLWMKIERIEPGFGIESIRLVAARCEPLGPEQLSGGGEPPDFARLVDRLASRLGARRLYKAGAVESDVPERSVRRLGPCAEPAPWANWPRPVRLLSPPERLDKVMALLPDLPPRRFTWRGRAYRVARADGPERIHGEWWKRTAEAEAVRDYFQVEDEEGARFWLYRRGDGADPGTGDLAWYLHGVFG